MTSYELYVTKPSLVASYVPITSKVHVIDRMLHNREAIIHILNNNLVMAQNQMKQQDN
jgi:hypothetical protein